MNHSTFIDPSRLCISKKDVELLSPSNKSLDREHLEFMREMLKRILKELEHKESLFNSQFTGLIDLTLAQPRPTHSPKYPHPKNPRPKVKNERVKSDKSRTEKSREFKKIDLSGDVQIWSNVNILFGKIPTREEIDELLSTPKYTIKPVPPGVHWSQKLIPIVKAHKESVKKSTNILMPPTAQLSNCEISSFWKDKTLTFQIEDEQMLNTSTLHRLLSAFVPSEPIKSDEKTEKKLFLKSTPLPPKLLCNEYIALPFNERLKCELDSIDLSLSHSTDGSATGPFVQEIEVFQHNIDELADKVKICRERIDEELDDIRKKEEKREENSKKFVDIVERYNRGEFN